MAERTLPSPEELMTLREFAISPSLQGNLYDIARVVDPQKRAFAVKTLKEDVLKHYPTGLSLSDVFDIHEKEHECFCRYLAPFIVETSFYRLILEDNSVYKICQPWVEHGIQYKEAIKNDRSVPDYQMPDLEERLNFLRGIKALFEDKEVRPKIADIDFFYM